MNSTNKLKKLADNGHADAQIKLGDCYYWGHGAEQDRAEAMAWHKRAADNGGEEAKNKLITYLSKNTMLIWPHRVGYVFDKNYTRYLAVDKHMCQYPCGYIYL